MLWIQGNFIMVGLPEDDLPPVQPNIFMANAGKMGASHIGSKKEVLEMLDLVAKKGIKPWYVLRGDERAEADDCFIGSKNFR